MACGQSTPDTQTHLVAMSTTVAYEWLTPWMPCIGIDNLKATLRVHGVSGNFQGQIAYQTALVRAAVPDSPAVVDSAQVGEGEKCTGVISIASATAGKFLVRFGVAYSLSSGTGVAQADVSTAFSFTQCGNVLGARALALDTSTSSDAFSPAAGWVPAMQVQKVKATVICRSLTGNFEWKLCYRVATTSQEDPGAWNALEASYHGAGEFDTGEITLNVDSSMYVQFGIQYHSTSGAGQAQVDVVYAVRRN